MKELSIEEKAKAYDEALHKAKRIINVCVDDNTECRSMIACIQQIFPEIKESEDEKIRKEILGYIIKGSESLYDVQQHGKERFEKWIAWLEKQGEQNLANSAKTCKDAQKTPDKVEPKFKISDLITNGILFGKIDGINELGYYAYFGDYYAYIPDVENWHKWTIQDAKDGDVLVASDDSIFLFKGTIDLGCKHYVALKTDGAIEFNVGLEHFWETSTAVHPATKEQRDLLFQKMKEAGYEWDAEKKELKKIEQKPAWSEEEVEIIDWLVSSFDCLKIPTDTFYQSKVRPFLILLRNKIQPIINEWSEEDEKMCQETIDWFEKKCFPYAIESENPARESIKWLKSLKNRVQPQDTWKPSDEQMHYLSWIANVKLGDGVVEQEVSKHLNELYQDLKKLKG